MKSVFSTRVLSLLLVIALFTGISVLVPVGIVHAATFSVDVSSDEADSNVGDGICDNGSGQCTLRAAIQEANNTSASDTIDFGITGTITLSSALPQISNDLEIQGPGASSLTVSGASLCGVLNVGSSATVTITEISIQNGYLSGADGAGINNSGTLILDNCRLSNNTARHGGAIYNTGTLQVSDCLLENNNTLNLNSLYAGAINNRNTAVVSNSIFDDNGANRAGAIYNHIGADLTVNNSTFTENTAYDTGGAIYNFEGTMALAHCTFYGNASAASRGGAIANLAGSGNAIMSLDQSTISGNSGRWGGGLFSGAFGGGVARVTITNTILADNSAASTGPDCQGTLDSGGHNLIEDTSDCTITGWTTGNITGQDALLEAARHNGGDTNTVALIPGSPAIDAVAAVSCTLTLDQRGEVRPADYREGGTCDIGAFELQPDETYSYSDLGADERLTFGATMVSISRTLSSGPMGTITVTKYITPPGLTHTSGEISVTWRISSSVTSGFTATLVFCYADAEIVGLTESDLRAYRWAGGNNWGSPLGSVDTAANCVTVNNVDQFGAWSLGTGAPTVISLRGLAALSGISAGGILLLAALAITLGWGGIAMIRRQRPR